MKLNALQRLGTAWSILKTGMSPGIAAFLKGEDSQNGSGATLTSAYSQSTWVYAAVNALAKNVSQIPFRIIQGDPDDENIVNRGPVVDLFARPHQFLDRFQFWELLVTWLSLRGEAFVVCLDKAGNVIAVRDAGKRNTVAQMLVLSPDRFWQIIQGGTLAGWRYTGMNYNDPPLDSQIFLPEEVLQLRLPNPFLFWRGMSPLSVAMLAASTDYASAQFMKGLMLNNADTGVIVTTEQQPTSEQREMILSALRDRKRQAGTADRPLLLAGGCKIEKPSVSSADMQFLENRKLNRLEIGAVFGVPSTVMGFSEDANRAIAGQERLNFVEQAIIPLCTRLEAFIEPVIQPFNKNYSGRFHSESLPIMQQARRERGDGATKFFAMGVPLNDINRVFALGLPEYPWGNTGYLPFNLQAAGTAPASTVDQTETDNEDKSFSEPLALVAGMLKIVKAIPDNAPPVITLPPVHECKGLPEYDASIAGSIKNKVGKLGKFFFEQRGRTLAKLDEINKAYNDNGKKVHVEVSFREYFVVARGIDDIFDKDAEDKELLKKMKPLQIADLEFGGAQLFQEIGVEGFKLAPADAIAFLAARENKITDVNRTTFDALKSSLQEGLAEGDTYEQLVARVKDVYQAATESRAQTIAATETNTAVNAGRSTAMVQAKVEKKGWGTSKLDNVRPTHQKAGAEYADGIPTDQPFIVGGAELMHPCDPNGPAQEVINCHCFVFAVVGGKMVKSAKPLRWEEHAK